MNPQKLLADLETELRHLFVQLAELQAQIRTSLSGHADGKLLKGNELVGWLGEIYGKILFGGRLVSDREEHDLITSDGRRISVKTRKGWGSGWRQTSAIPKIDGEECPTHLLFVHLNDDYSIDRMWLFEWEAIRRAGRFRSHVVRGQHRAFIFFLDEKSDQACLVHGEACPKAAGMVDNRQGAAKLLDAVQDVVKCEGSV